MCLALQQAEIAFQSGEVPVGALIVSPSGEVLVATHNEQEKAEDVTCHAELLAIKRISALRQTRYCPDLTLYVTLEPCPMCAGAILLARFRRLVYGAFDSRLGAVDSVFSLINYPYLHANTEVCGGILETECRTILQSFFQKQRQKCPIAPNK